MFRADSAPLLPGKRIVNMVEVDAAGAQTQRQRPAARILLKDAPEPSFKAVCALDAERFALAWGGPYIGSQVGTEIRALPDARLLDSFPGLAAPFSLRAPYLLTNGPLSGGYPSTTRVLHLDEKKVVAELPVAHPYLLTAGNALFAHIRRHHELQFDPIADQALVAPFPELAAIIAAEGGVVVKLSLEGKVAFTLSEKDLAPVYAEIVGLQLSADESTLYFAGRRSVGAVDLFTQEVRWVQHFGENQGEHFLSLGRMALSPDEKRLAVGGTAGPWEPQLRVLSTSDGKVLAEMKRSGRVEALAFHGDVLIAAGNQGWLTLFDETYQRRDAKVATSGINDIAVIGGGVLCACDQRQLRLVSLLDDE